jgi:hypothetical protein
VEIEKSNKAKGNCWLLICCDAKNNASVKRCDEWIWIFLCKYVAVKYYVLPVNFDGDVEREGMRCDMEPMTRNIRKGHSIGTILVV